MVADPNRVKEIFLGATEQPNETARAAYLDRACGGDAGLRDRVEALLRSHDRAASFLGTPAAVAPDPNRGDTMAIDPTADSAATRDGGKPHPVQDEESDDLQFLAPPTRPDALGRLGHYQMLQVLGRGGFGIVFRAFDDMLQRVVAIKVMAPQIATLSPARKRFLREARSSAAVRHDNVVHVYEVGEQPLPYLVMEFIPGETLQHKLDRMGPLDVPEVLRIGRQIAEGLAAAHASDLIHRDIKPGNILLEGGSQKVKITDFGLARAADDASISQSGIVAGTPMFMSPEQALGHSIDQRADLFSFGSVLYQMVSGRPPFRAPSALAVLKRVAEEPPRPIPEIIPEAPDWLCGIITKLHAKNPADRFQSAREVADLLADCEAKLKAKQAVKNVLPAAAKPAAPTASAGWKWVAAAAVLLLPVIGLAVTEIAGVTHLFRQQVTPVTGPVLVAKNELPPLADGWVPLFNGKDLSGWKTHDLAPGNWRVEDGAIVGRGDKSFESFLFSESEYADFHLRVEAKINAIGDSGVIFRAPFDVRLWDGGTKIRLAGGYEAQIAVKSNYRIHTGSLLWDGEPPQPGPPFIQPGPLMPHRPDEWFVLEVIAQGNRIQTFVNGKKMVDYVDEQRRYDRGHLALQTWGGNITFVQFRKIEIKKLPPDPESQKQPLPPTFKNGIGMEFVIVPKGKSWLGGSKGKSGDNEVEILADFYLGKYEVTQEEWEKVMGDNPSHFSRTGGGIDAVKAINDADLKRFPVDNVSWDQCQIFVAKLNKLEKETGWVYRLPKEAEWEYACRGGPMADKLDSAFDFYLVKPTNTLLLEQANIGADKGLNRTCKVGSYKPNVLGLYDMHGNVWEWCDDLFDPKNPATASDRVYRGGGSWGNDGDFCQAVMRGWALPTAPDLHLGLRLARVPSGAAAPEVKTPPPDTKSPVDVAPPAPTVHDNWIKAIALLPLDQQAAALPAKLQERLPDFDAAFLRAIPAMSADRQGIMAEAWLKERKPAFAGFEDAWFKAIPTMSADKQVVLVAAWLRERNPSFDGEVTPKFVDGVVTSLEVPSPLVQDLTPLRTLTGLRSLKARSALGYDNQATRDADLLPLLKKLETINGKPVAQFWKDVEVKQAEFKEWLKLVPALDAKQQSEAVAAKLKERNPGSPCYVTVKTESDVVTEIWIHEAYDLTDLSPVRALVGLKSFKTDAGAGGHLSDVSPLAGIKDLTHIYLGGMKVRDLSPLKGLPLTSLALHGCPHLQDLSPLRGMKLTSLSLAGCQLVKDLSPLEGMPLTSLNFHTCSQIQDISPLKGMPLTSLNLHDGPKVVDLEPLKGMKLTELMLGGNGVQDFSPLQGMPLTMLGLSHCRQVQDLSSLKGLPLTTLLIDDTQVRDLEPLKDMPLKKLYIDSPGVTDLKPLQAMQLEDIRVTPKNITQGLDNLRSMKSLTTIGLSHYQAWPAAEFWDRYDKGEFTK